MKELKDTNALVEEFMLLANIYVAKKISEAFPDSAVLRRHPKPPQNNFETLIKALAPLGITINPETSKSLADSLDTAQTNDPYFNKLIRIMTTRCMMQAQYFCSGTLAQADFWHYGLASPIYTHFTSPIRRYADLQVHRLLAAAIGYEKSYGSDLLDKIAVRETCDGLIFINVVLNYRHRQAQQASRSSVELFTNSFFKNKTVVEDAYVIKVLKNGMVVLIPKYGVEGVVYTSVKGEAPVMQLCDGKLVAVNGNVTISLFDGVKVQVQVVSEDENNHRSKIKISLLEPILINSEQQPNSNKRLKVQK